VRLLPILFENSLYKSILLGFLLIAAILLQQNTLLKSWDNAFYDAELSLFFRPSSEDIVIVAIDNYSLEKLGKWPWPHRKHAELINLLSKAEVRAIGMDIIFAEPDENDLEADKELENAVRNNGRVILPVFPDMSNTDTALRVSSPWHSLTDSTAGLGHVDVEIDNDGVVRSAYLTAGMKGVYWPSFALAVLSAENKNVQQYLKGVRNPDSNSSPDLWSRDFRIEVPFVDSFRHFNQVSYADILLDTNLSKQLRNKYVLVGVTAAGLAQRFITPNYKTSGSISGVEFHANVLDALLNNIAIQSLTDGYSFILTVLLTLLPLLGYYFFFKRHALVVTVIFSFATILVSAVLLKTHHFWYGPSAVILVLVFSYLLWNSQRFRFFSKSLMKEKQLSDATLDSVADAVITTNTQGAIVFINPIAEKLTGFSLGKAKGLHIDSVVRLVNNENKEPDRGFADYISYLNKGKSIKEVAPRFLINNCGDEYAIRINGSPIKGEAEISGVVFAFSDITEILQSNKRISHLSTHDPLTGLPNQALCYQQIEKAIATSNRQGSFLALLFIDLDDFKKVNDGMGHTVGDLLLAEVATRLLANMRQTDTVARWGGDEFVVLLNQLPIEENITGIIVKILERLSQPFYFEGQTLYVTPSIGISVYPKDGSNSEELLVNAESALLQVKENGRNNFGFFSSGFDKSAKLRLVMEKELYCALADCQFEVYYQPQIEPKTSRIVGAEALLRWNHPIKGIISPDTFIPLAEDTGLINPIGDWVLQTVCKQLSTWQKQGLPEICVAINVSPRQFLQNNLSAKIAEALNDNNLPARFLKVEITERLMIKNVDRVAKMLWEFRELGISVSIDDFGTGFSSLSALKNFPIDQLKIDKFFVNHLGYSRDDANIAQSIITLGHNMGMDVVAEGVENKTQLDCLVEWGCDYIQGFYYSKPLTSSRMLELLKEGQIINKNNHFQSH
jgi:diguanylate cyclase (GGDEF)-like protein/PAS domain S-box-containing protein